jgi:glycosyltransferase involved in cell wall biosynthesis
VTRTRDLVSIVIPVFNGARYVGEAIESALAQTWPNVEIIVVNDGSNDGGATQRAIERYGDAVRVIVKANGGVATALNAGIAAMRGDWFSWLSHDDLYMPTKIERYMEVLNVDGAPAIAFGDVELIDAYGARIGESRLTRGFSAADDPRWVVLEGRLNGCAMLVPRVCLATCGGFDPGLPTTQDYAYWFELARHFRFVPVREPLVRSRSHAEQESRGARHLEEASLRWLAMLDELDLEDGAADAGQRLRRLYRVWKFLQASSYDGARAYVESRIAKHLTDVPVALICDDAGGGEAGVALQMLSAAGGRCTELVLIDRTNDASVVLDRTTWTSVSIAQTTRVPMPEPCPSSVLRAAASCCSADLLVFLDSSAPIESLALRQGLAAVATDEADGWLAGAATQPGHAWLGALCGSVIRREHAANAGRHGAHALEQLGLRSRLSMVRPLDALPTSKQAARPAPIARQRYGHPALSLGAQPSGTRPTLLILVHSLGGGTLRYAETVAGLVKNRVNVLFGWGVENRVFRLSSVSADAGEVDYELPDELDRLILDLRGLAVTRLDVMHSIGFDVHLESLLERLGVPFDLTLLDYHQVALHPHLVDDAGQFVGDHALVSGKHGLLRPAPLPARLHAADRVIACSRDLAGRFGRLARGMPLIAAKLPEPGNPEKFALHPPPLRPGAPMRVLYLGSLARHKGVHTIARVGELLRERRLRIRIDCLGHRDVDLAPDILVNPHLRVLGPYASGDLNALVCQMRPHVAWLPFTAPETHSFSLSDVMLQGLPVLATAIGAIPERVEGRPLTWLVEPDEASPEGIVAWLERLQRDCLTTPPRWLPVNHLPASKRNFYEREYLLPLLGELR